MKKFIKVLTLALSLLLPLAALPNIANASTQSKIGDTVQIGKYKGVLISSKDLPKNVVPIKAASMQEAEEIINNADAAFTASSVQSKVVGTDTSKILSSAPTGNSQDVVNGGPLTGISFHVVVHYTHNGSVFSSCTSISSYLSGLTTFMSWAQTDSNYSILYHGSQLYTTVNGNTVYYIITPIGLVGMPSVARTVDTYFYCS